MDVAAVAEALRDQLSALEGDLIYLGSEIQRVEGELTSRLDELRDQQEKVCQHLDDAANQLQYAINMAPALGPTE